MIIMSIKTEGIDAWMAQLQLNESEQEKRKKLIEVTQAELEALRRDNRTIRDTILLLKRQAGISDKSFEKEYAPAIAGSPAYIRTAVLAALTALGRFSSKQEIQKTVAGKFNVERDIMSQQLKLLKKAGKLRLLKLNNSAKQVYWGLTDWVIDGKIQSERDIQRDNKTIDNEQLQ